MCDLLCRANSSERANERLQSFHTHLNGFSPKNQNEHELKESIKLVLQISRTFSHHRIM